MNFIYICSIFEPVNRKDIPTYTIVEVLIRISELNSLIGDFEWFDVEGEDVQIMTTTGTIAIPFKVVLKQLKRPKSISRLDLLELSLNFRPKNLKEG